MEELINSFLLVSLALLSGNALAFACYYYKETWDMYKSIMPAVILVFLSIPFIIAIVIYETMERITE